DLANLTDNAGASGSNIGSTLANLLDADADSASSLANIASKIEGKFKSKAYTGQKIKISYSAAAGKTYVWVKTAQPKDGAKTTVVSD
ncbi:MAG: hypothetical protein Q4D32_07015, partial [Eubacteriales bacterium]|nr:hypothetical protein [Eubacteriales bacterium]